MKKPLALGSLILLALAVFEAGRYSAAGSKPDKRKGEKHVLYYVDPMHPSYHSDKPGIAPDCGMALEPVYEGEDPGAKLQLPPGAVSISPEKQLLIGVRVVSVEKNSGSRLIRTTGRVEVDNSKVFRVMGGTEGWVRSVQNNPPGTLVKRDDLLASVYSNEFRNAEQAYLGALASLDRVKTSSLAPDESRTSNANLRINEEQLRALGMGEPQMKELAKSRQITRDVTLTSPIDGIVLSRDVFPGQRFDKGSEFYRIADLRKVWITADLFGRDAQFFTPGARVKATVRERGKTILATVSHTPAIFDAASRTLKLRLEADNPGFILRPDMFVDLEFNAKAPEGLAVPQDAVIDSGLQKIVYVEASDGVFEPRPVILGAPFGDFITVTSGLAVGDKVVTSGNFLIDSESKMRSSALVSPSVIEDAHASSDQNDALALQDPVCGMHLDPKSASSAGHSEKYQGELFHFCSDKCQKKFQQDPAKYASIQVGSVSSPASATTPE
jgi:membrane fusion protein, copper/silver efflux system